MRVKGYLLVIILMFGIFGASFHSNKNTPYDEYYSWYIKEIAVPIDKAWKQSNESQTIKEYKKTRGKFLKAYNKAVAYQLPDEALFKAHKQLSAYLKWRVQYLNGFILYLETKSRDTKALVNNYLDEGNTHYSQFISSLEEYAIKSKQTFITPRYLY